jgi:hypothetical protein
MKHSKDEVTAWMWLQRQFYKCGLLTKEQIEKLEGIKGWTWEDLGATPPTASVRKRVMREILNGYLHQHQLTPEQSQEIGRLSH